MPLNHKPNPATSHIPMRQTANMPATATWPRTRTNQPEPISQAVTSRNDAASACHTSGGNSTRPRAATIAAAPASATAALSSNRTRVGPRIWPITLVVVSANSAALSRANNDCAPAGATTRTWSISTPSGRLSPGSTTVSLSRLSRSVPS